LTESVVAASRWIAQVPSQLGENVKRRLLAERRHFDQLTRRLQTVHPRRQLNERRQQVDEYHIAFSRAARQQLHNLRLAWQTRRDRLILLRPDRMLALRRQSLLEQRRRLNAQARLLLRDLRRHAAALDDRLRLLGPEQVLARGYSITMDAATGRILRAASETAPGQMLKTRLKTGEVSSTVSDRR
jgi:exodeoxyribonuclease VII large subunit